MRIRTSKALAWPEDTLEGGGRVCSVVNLPYHTDMNMVIDAVMDTAKWLLITYSVADESTNGLHIRVVPDSSWDLPAWKTCLLRRVSGLHCTLSSSERAATDCQEAWQGRGGIALATTSHGVGGTIQW